jgi:tRNA A-37 threonylcarbamoyl transferase component Bud32
MSTPTPTTQMPEVTERTLEGRIVGEYVVEGRLGRGAFGTVYKGVHPLIGKAVAIKVLSHRFSADPEMVSRFVAEARAVNQIRHRHIIDIFSFGQLEDGRHYYVMEYLEGETLQALLEREHRLPIARCFTILRAIGRALDAAHAKGIAHRDLKAENIFLGTDADGEVWPKLLDFGIAKLIHVEDGLTHRTRSGVSIGTPRYMSPEQCHGRQIDHRTDIYAFGILVYRMLTGVFPFDGASYIEILMKQVGAEAIPPSAHVPELPDAIDGVVLWFVHKEPAQRPPDLKTAVAVLEQAAERAGLVTSASWINPWDAVAGSAETQPATVVALERARAPRRGASATPWKGVLETGRGAGRMAGTMAPHATLAGARRSGKASILASILTVASLPVLAVASLVAITAIVAAMVALYPRTDDAPVNLVARRAQPSASPRPALGAPGPGTQGQGIGPAAEQPRQGRSPAAAAASGPRAPAASPSVIVTIAGVPSGTDVVAGGRRVGVAPGPVQLPYGADPLTLTFQARGYLPAGRPVVPDRDRSLSLTLARQPLEPPAPGGKHTAKDDLIEALRSDSPGSR